MAEAWNPWRALRDRTDVQFKLAQIDDSRGGALLLGDFQGWLLIIDSRLSRQARRVLLAHELVHLERGGVCCRSDHPAAWEPIVRREEEIVDRIVAERLIPSRSLDRWLERQPESVTAFDVAEEWDVTKAVAERALRRPRSTVAA